MRVRALILPLLQLTHEQSVSLQNRASFEPPPIAFEQSLCSTVSRRRSYVVFVGSGRLPKLAYLILKGAKALADMFIAFLPGGWMTASTLI